MSKPASWENVEIGSGVVLVKCQKSLCVPYEVGKAGTVDNMTWDQFVWVKFDSGEPWAVEWDSVEVVDDTD